MLAALATLLATPAFAGAPDAAPQVEVPAVAGLEAEAPATEAQSAGIDIDTWIAAGTDQAMQEAVAQSGVEQAAGCTASCGFGGPSCSGNSTCFEEPNCFIYCDTTGIIRCGTICP
jgi:hypothetical protein